MDGRQTFLDTDFSKAFAGFTLPGFDVEAVLASQRKNIEALTQANQLAVEGVQAVARRQAEITREAIDEASAVLRDIVQPTAPEDRIAKNAELLKQTFERGLATTRELTLMLTKANTEAFDVVAKRVAAGFEEIRDEAKKRVAK
ncbi:MAG: TIGR01841 family phasin [Alphaproteobacteria bacterium]|jgi:phasin family protein|nr:TIGR01841 family phasin [Alphaproteobacteria bacterium]